MRSAMRIARASAALILILFCFASHASESDPQKVTLTGTLTRAMAVGGESTGWIVQVDSATMIDGKPISSIEVSDTRKPKELEALQNKRVKIAGKVVYRHGVETGIQPYIEISSIKQLGKSVSKAAGLPIGDPQITDRQIADKTHLAVAHFLPSRAGFCIQERPDFFLLFSQSNYRASPQSKN